MNYYKRHIGDYHKKAGRLTMLQHGAYTLLIDACYDRERFPTFEEACEWCWAFSEPEKDAVRFVLDRFWTEKDGIYYQSRIKEELENYHKNSETNKKIAIEREARKRTNRAKACTNEHLTTNHKPLTTNQEPLTKNHKPRTKNQEPKSKTLAPKELLASLGIDPKIAADWITLRRQKKAAITETALKGIQREADKAGMSLENALATSCERGWTGFKAEWVNKKLGKNPNEGRDLEAEMRAFAGEDVG